MALARQPLQFLVSSVGVERVMLGTDYPFRMSSPGGMVEFIKGCSFLSPPGPGVDPGRQRRPGAGPCCPRPALAPARRRSEAEGPDLAQRVRAHRLGNALKFY